MRDQQRYSRRRQSEIADIGFIPEVAAPARRLACRLDLEAFLVAYFPFTTGLSPLSDDHKRVVSRIQQSILEGGRFANVVYRGFAKTTISQNASLWATLYGHRRFVVIFGADAEAASNNVSSIKMELSENELLYADFPEVCHAIWALEGKPQRCASQTHVPGSYGDFVPADGTEPRRTHIMWTSEKVVLPSIVLPDGASAGGGAVIACRGVTGGSRGMVHKRADGGQQRPDLVILDDPQTDESASTELQVRKRLNTIKKAILKLGGHNKQLSVVLNATPIQPDDLVEQLLDPTRNPSWQSERIPMVRAWSESHDGLWLDRYAHLRNTYDKDVIGDQKRAHESATAVYVERRAEMDAGCQVSWEHCYDHETELSAIQHAYNILIDDGLEVFRSECQCQPMRAQLGQAEEVTAKGIAARLTRLPRGTVPTSATILSAFIDVQQSMLFYAVCAWSENFTGTVIDYGVFPDQKRAHFTLADGKQTLQQLYPRAGAEGQIYAGLTALSEHLLSRDWQREDGAGMRIGRCIVDSGFETQTVYMFCRQSPHAAILLPSKGDGVSAKGTPYSEWPIKPGEKKGENWLISTTGGRQRLLKYDTNYWKSAVYTRLATAIGDAGALTLFGSQAEEHELFAAHLTAEFRVKTGGRGRELYEWDDKPGHPDNHWFDAIVGCAVGASMQGARVLASTGADAAPKRVSFAAAQAAARAGR